MTEKDLKRLGKTDLIRLVLKMEAREQELSERIGQLDAQKEEWEMQVSEAGSIAEAVVGMSGIFQKAQATADQYLKQVYAANRDTEARCSAMLHEAESQAAEIVRKAEEDSADRLRQADADISARWEEFRIKAERFLKAHAELKAMLPE